MPSRWISMNTSRTHIRNVPEDSIRIDLCRDLIHACCVVIEARITNFSPDKVTHWTPAKRL